MEIIFNKIRQCYFKSHCRGGKLAFSKKIKKTDMKTESKTNVRTTFVQN